MVVSISGVGQGVCELLQVVYTKFLHLLRFFCSSKLKFGFPNLGEQSPCGDEPSCCKIGQFAMQVLTGVANPQFGSPE